MDFKMLLLALGALEKEIESLIAMEQALRIKPREKWGMRDYELATWVFKRQGMWQETLGKTAADLLEDIRAARTQWAQDAQTAQSEGRYLQLTFLN